MARVSMPSVLLMTALLTSCYGVTSAMDSSVAVVTDTNSSHAGGRHLLSHDACPSTVNLNSYSSPYTGTTVGRSDFFSPSCTGTATAPEMAFVISVPAGSQITFQQTTNNYDSVHELRWGGSCPGDNYVQCVDDDDYTSVSWTNTYSSTQTVYYIQSGYSSYSGTFTLAWAVDSSGCMNTCAYANDGVCDDGGTGSTYSDCDFGTDCADCGARTSAVSAPPPASCASWASAGECTANPTYMYNYCAAFCVVTATITPPPSPPSPPPPRPPPSPPPPPKDNNGVMEGLKDATGEVDSAVTPVAEAAWEDGIVPIIAVGVGGVTVLGGGIMLVQAAMRLCAGGGSGASAGSSPTFEPNALAQVYVPQAAQAPAATAMAITQIKLGADTVVAL